MLAQKIEVFINRRGPPILKEILLQPKRSSTFAESITRNRWQSKNGNLEVSNNENRCIEISGFSGLSEKDILNRCFLEIAILSPGCQANGV